MKQCSQCKKDVFSLDEFCRSCGEPVESMFCSECNSAVEDKDKFCWKCGSELAEEE